MIADLAARLNLSKGTVSRILNHKGQAFSEETRRRVFALADEMGYRPHPVARALATGRSGVLGFWVQDLLTAYHAHVAHQMEAHLERRGYQVFITLFGKSADGGARNAPLPMLADGIIAHEVNRDQWVALLEPLKGRLPIVTTGAWYPNEEADHVGVDLGPAALAAVRHFVASGRRRIAYVTDRLEWRMQDRETRFQCYRAMMGESGLPEEYIETLGQDRASVRAKARAYFEAKGCPEALFCHNDDAAIAAYCALSDLGHRVPDDVAIIGCDGIEDTEYLPTPLSTIVQPLGEMCETAARFLERRLKEPDLPPQRVTLQPELVLRASAGLPPAD